ncbi:hypothetical protein EK904_006873 [Melospiza melodia maxima]|nr:hypothetical protein EK904_006873 [Melospiza melodia maxima]
MSDKSRAVSSARAPRVTVLPFERVPHECHQLPPGARSPGRRSPLWEPQAQLSASTLGNGTKSARARVRAEWRAGTWRPDQVNSQAALFLPPAIDLQQSGCSAQVKFCLMSFARSWKSQR